MRIKNRPYAVGILAVSIGYCVQATAAPIFTFTEYSGFSMDVGKAQYSEQVQGDASLIPATSPVYSEMSWVGKGPRPKSSLELNSVNESTSIAADTWTTISTLTHNNLIIPGVFSWSSQNIWGRFMVTDADGGSTVVLDSENVITVSLTETLNRGTCAAPNPLGSVCDDYFTFTAGLEDLFFAANDGSEWQASFRFANLMNASQIANTIFTGEGVSSSLDVQVLLTGLSNSRFASSSALQSIPEPATLGMLGFGLFGLRRTWRRRTTTG